MKYEDPFRSTMSISSLFVGWVIAAIMGVILGFCVAAAYGIPPQEVIDNIISAWEARSALDN